MAGDGAFHKIRMAAYIIQFSLDLFIYCLCSTNLYNHIPNLSLVDAAFQSVVGDSGVASVSSGRNPQPSPDVPIVAVSQCLRMVLNHETRS